MKQYNLRKIAMLVLFGSFLVLPISFAQDYNNQVIDHQYINGALIKNSTITNSEVVNSFIDRSNVTNSTIKTSTTNFTNFYGVTIDKSSLYNSVDISHAHLSYVYSYGSSIDFSYGEFVKIENSGVQRSEFENIYITHAELSHLTINGAHIDQSSVDSFLISNVDMNNVGLSNGDIYNASLMNFNSKSIVIRNAEIGGSTLNDTVLCKVYDKDNQQYYDSCTRINGIGNVKQVPFVGLWTIYRMNNGGNEVIRHNFTTMVDADTIVDIVSEPVVVNNTIVSYKSYTQEININTRLVEITSIDVSASDFNGKPGAVPQGQYTDLWISKDLKFGENVTIRDKVNTVVGFSHNSIFVSPNNNSFGAGEYSQLNGIFFGYSVPVPTARLSENNAF